jgi:hypothetical protein
LEESVAILEARVANEIYSPRLAHEKGLDTCAPHFLGGSIAGEEAWLVYRHIGKGVFFDDYLIARESFETKFSLDSVLDSIAEQFARLHGKKGETGRRHGDLNTGNVFIQIEEDEQTQPKILIIDWELCDHQLPEVELTKSARHQDIFSLAGQKRNLSNAARLEREGFLRLKRKYDTIVGF